MARFNSAFREICGYGGADAPVGVTCTATIRAARQKPVRSRLCRSVLKTAVAAGRPPPPAVPILMAAILWPLWKPADPSSEISQLSPFQPNVRWQLISGYRAVFEKHQETMTAHRSTPTALLYKLASPLPDMYALIDLASTDRPTNSPPALPISLPCSVILIWCAV